MNEKSSISDEKLCGLMEIVEKRYGKVPYIIESTMTKPLLMNTNTSTQKPLN